MDKNPSSDNPGSFPESYTTDISMLPVFDQRQIPACVAHAVVTMMQLYWYRKIGKIIPFSPRFLDILSWTHGLGINDGRDPRVVMELAYRVGCCTEALLLNDTSLPVEQYRNRALITQAMLDEAFQYRMSR